MHGTWNTTALGSSPWNGAADINQFRRQSRPTQTPLGWPYWIRASCGATAGAPAIPGMPKGYVLPHRSPDDTDPRHWYFCCWARFVVVIVGPQLGRASLSGLFLVSGRVFNHDGDSQTEFVENAVEQAVKICMPSLAAASSASAMETTNKVPLGGGMSAGLAYTLDPPHQELGVLLWWCVGNLLLDDVLKDPAWALPGYLLEIMPDWWTRLRHLTR